MNRTPRLPRTNKSFTSVGRHCETETEDSAERSMIQLTNLKLYRFYLIIQLDFESIDAKHKLTTNLRFA